MTNIKYYCKRLKYLASINDDTLSEITNPDLEIKYIDIGNVNSFGELEEPTIYKFGDAPSRARRIIKKGDVIISTVRTYLRAIASIDKDVENYIVSTGFAVIRPKKDVFHPEYCKYVLTESSFIDEVQKRSTGVSYPAINASDLGDILIPVPCYKVQEKIGRFLSEEIEGIEKLINAKKDLLNLLSKKHQALITQAVTRGIDPSVKLKDSGIDWLGEIPDHWETIKIKFITSKIGSGVTPRGGASVYLDEGIPLLRSQNVHFNGLKLDDVAYISEETHKNMSNSMVQSNDVLLNITGASIGRCYYYEGQLGEANVNQHVCILRPNKKVYPQYLYLLLSSSIGQTQIAQHQVGGGREGLTFDSLKSFIVSLPPISEQAKIIEEYKMQNNKFNTLYNSTKKSITLLKERRTAIISAAVTGQLNIPEIS